MADPKRSPDAEPAKKPIPWSRADRINHLLAEVHREVKDLHEVGLDVIEVADLGAMIDPLKDEINRRREETDQHGRKMGTTIVTVEGITYRVHRNENGSTVDTPCTCFGMPQRTHNNVHCPWLAQRAERVEEGRD